MASKQTKKNTLKAENAASKNKALEKVLTPVQLVRAKKHYIEMLKTAFDSEDIVEKYWKEFKTLINAGNSARKMITKEHAELFTKVMTVYGLDNHEPLSETVEERYRPLVVEFSRNLVEDYSCQTSGEKALAEVIVSAYIRILVVSGRLNGALAPESVPISHEHTTFYSMLSKELDRANRHFTSSLQTLIQIKQPSLNVNLKTKNAYVAQAQQFNMGNPEPKEAEEIINPK